MPAVLYYFTLPFIYLLSVLPFSLLYLLSDLVYYLLYYVLGYRKRVVMQNLRNSFPEKTEKEILAIARRFYRYFCDLFLETFKTLSISPKTMLKHCWLDADSLRLFGELAAENQSIMVVMGHQGNWEWAGNSFSLVCKHQLYVIYHPLSNKYFNGLVYKMRTRFGTKLIAMKDTLRDMLNNRDELSATAFIADQSPQPDRAYWMNFLNQDTPVFLGIEKIALKIRYPVVYVAIKRVKRGYYSMHAERIELPLPADSSRLGEITELHTGKLEADIRKQPETWLWTHRRWKHSRN
ncbi:MAG: lysophospholipid acyltransferase family protein [Bacteroidota bacterium]|nr:lysophospholipid acyltransferase family protein [Bacteroidota bacterium]MDP4212456.1 lysophospholipid acyltransferase family protein [Bacteroidota bacterium]MDP4248817.1 lysophospholipid acyltransferase family protein [Bacteroidota bacterium]